MMAPGSSETDQKSCPVCGQLNHCGIANTSGSNKGCWCKEVDLSDDDRKNLRAKGFEPSCLCYACLLKYKSN